MMSFARFRRTYDAQTTQARKVFDHVPIDITHTASDVLASMKRAGHASDIRFTTGCLDTLVNAGIVTERVSGFIRTPFKPPVKIQPQPETSTVSALPKLAFPTEAITTPPLDQLAKLATRCKALAESVKELAEDIDVAALDIREQMDATGEDTQKLRQLQSILKSIG